MFEATTWYRVRCDAPGCIRTVMDHDCDQPLLIHSPDVDQIPAGAATDDDGTPWQVCSHTNRVWCPTHETP